MHVHLLVSILEISLGGLPLGGVRDMRGCSSISGSSNQQLLW